MTAVRFILIAVLASLLFPSSAYAYLDPGTGSLIIQTIIGGIAGLALFFKLYRKRLLAFFGRRQEPEQEDQDQGERIA